MKRISVPAPAKLNLFLHITGQRPNGYHDLQTVFQFIDLEDTLHFTLVPTSGTQNPIKVQTGSVPTPEDTTNITEDIPEQDNLIYKAALALMPYNQTGLGIEIEFQKAIPSGAGLGGGSSDAATTLLTLNKLWKCNLPTDQLKDLGLSLGADVPVFINGKAAFAEGVGEHLTDIEPNTPWYVVIKPSAHISTAEIFSHPDLTRNTPTLKISAALEHGGHNDCEKVVRKLYPEVDNAMKWLDKFSPSKLTGTGACVFAAFENKEHAELAAQQYSDKDAVFVVKGLNDNPAQSVLQRISQEFAL